MRFPTSDSLLSVNSLQAGHFLLKLVRANSAALRHTTGMSVLNMTQSISLQWSARSLQQEALVLWKYNGG